MADFELNPDMVLGPSGKLELLYNRAMERSKAQSNCEPLSPKPGETLQHTLIL